MTVFEEAVNGYAELSKEFKGKSPNLDRCGQILGKLKIALTQLSFLPNDEAPSNKVKNKSFARWGFNGTSKIYIYFPGLI